MPLPRRGFTLIEILIVVAILGILAALIVPQFTDASASASRANFTANLRHLHKVASVYFELHDALPQQGAGEPMPAIPPELFAAAGEGGNFPARTELGGYWHVGRIGMSGEFGVGVWWPTDNGGQNVIRGVAVDEEIDDGDPATGRFRFATATQQYYLLVE